MDNPDIIRLYRQALTKENVENYMSRYDHWKEETDSLLHRDGRFSVVEHGGQIVLFDFELKSREGANVRPSVFQDYKELSKHLIDIINEKIKK